MAATYCLMNARRMYVKDDHGVKQSIAGECNSSATVMNCWRKRENRVSRRALRLECSEVNATPQKHNKCAVYRQPCDGWS